jgi:hypothetical protein
VSSSRSIAALRKLSGVRTTSLKSDRGGFPALLPARWARKATCSFSCGATARTYSRSGSSSRPAAAAAR